MDYRDLDPSYDDDPLYDPRVALGDSRRDRERDRENFLYYRDRRRERSRERYRERGRDRSLIRVPRDRNRERDYRYDVNRRDREREYERSDYEDYRYDDYEGDYHSERTYESRSYDREIRDRDRDRDRERERDRDRTSWREEQPNNTIMLRNLAQHITEEHIRAEVLPLVVPIIDVRLMRKKDTGTSRGFAFVEFQNMSDAMRWMEQKQGSLSFSDGTKCSMHYSMPRPDDHNLRVYANKSDWSCSKCGAHNFKRREYCFKCNISREESENIRLGDGHDEVGTIPCNTLLLRNLDVLTLEDKILGALQEVSSLPIKNIRIAKDTLTNTSRGFCYVELNSTHECTQLVDTLTAMSPPLTIEGRQVAVSYSRQSLSSLASPSAAGMANSAIAAAQWSNQKVNVHSGSTDYIQDSSQPSQTYYAGQSADYSQYYQNYDYSNYDSTNTANGSSQADSTNAAAAVALNAMQQVQAVKNYQQQQQNLQQHIIAQMQQPKKEGKTEERLAHEAQQWSQQQEKKDSDASSATNQSVDYVKYPVPDVSTYQYDASSGYYYDPLTSLYYDANSQYYYNAQTQRFLYWDAEKRSYLPAPTTDESTAAMAGTLSNQGKEKPKKEKDKQDRVKIAKKIAKDMEKWAKTLNQKKEGFKQGFVPIGQFTVILGGDSKPSPTADAGYAMLEKRATVAERVVTMEVVRKKQTEEKVLMPPPPPKGTTKASNLSIVAAYGSESDSESEEDDTNIEVKLIDLSKLACLLCKRQFQTKEALTRHQQISDLHKQNLEALQRNKAADSEMNEMERKARDAKYRDRAKERREKYGEPEPPKSNKLREKYYQVKNDDFEQPTKTGIGSDNIGNKMLKAMGWTEGTGLGRKNQGIVDPIAAQRRAAAVGLGMKGSTFVAAPGDSYKDAVKKLTQARYSEIE